jgi:hypothetical protein
MYRYFLDAGAAVLQLYALLFAGCLLLLCWGIRLLYKALTVKDTYLLRKSKMIVLLAIIGMLCIAVVSFLLTGKIPG